MAATPGALAYVQLMYIAYYGRAADPAGLAYWAERVDSEGAPRVADAFGTSAEFVQNYGDFSNRQLVDGLYRQLLGRAADPEGLAFYVEGLQRGDYSLPDIALRIIDGVQPQSSDFQILANRLQVAQYATGRGVDESMLASIVDAVSGEAESAIAALQRILDQGRTAFVASDRAIDDPAQTIGITATASATATAIDGSPLASIGMTGVPYSGQGFSIVVLDTGIDADNAAFGADADGDGIADRIVYTEDFTGEGDNSANDGNGHGTLIASLVAGGDTVHNGVAPGANIIALQVLGANGQGTSGSMQEALDWVLDNRSAFNIAAVVMPFSDSGNYPNGAGAPDYAGDEVRDLESAGIIAVAAAGNRYASFESQGAAYPAAAPTVIGVGSTFFADQGGYAWLNGAVANSSAADHIAPFSQRDAVTARIFAPGVDIGGALPGTGSAALTGTSASAGLVAGVAAVAQEAAQQLLGRPLTPSEFRSFLQQSAVAITDNDGEDDNVADTGSTYYRVDAAALIARIEAFAATAPSPPADLVPGNTSTTFTLEPGGPAIGGTIDTGPDQDWYGVALDAGGEYRFSVAGTGGFDNVGIALYDAAGLFVQTAPTVAGSTVSLDFAAPASATFYVAATSGPGLTDTGDFLISAVQTGAVSDTIPGSILSDTALGAGAPVASAIDFDGDEDWLRLVLEEGVTYTYTLDVAPQGAQLQLRDGGGDPLPGTGTGSATTPLAFVPQASGVYYLNVSADSVGDYSVSVDEEQPPEPPPPPADLEPIAVSDLGSATERGDAIAGNVLANDVQGDAPAVVTSANQGGRALVIGSAFTTDGGGLLTLNADGSYSYAPPADGVPAGGLQELIVYTIADADGDTASAALTITVANADPQPVAVADSAAAEEGGLAVSGSVLTNDDPGDAPATVTLASQDGASITLGTVFLTAGGGSLTLNADGSYSYTPPAEVPDAGLSEVFAYTIADQDGDTASATLTVSVGADLQPVAVVDLASAEAGGDPVLGNVLENDTPGDAPAAVSAAGQGGSPIALGVPFTTAGGGSLTLNADGSWSYTPPAELLGDDLQEVFDYTLTDADGDAASSTLTITVGADLLPLAVADTLAVSGGGPTASGSVLDNDTLGDTPTQVTLASQGDSPITLGVPFLTAAGGSLTLNADGSYDYTPPAAGDVPDGGAEELFSYTIADDDGDESSATLTIQVTVADDVVNGSAIGDASDAVDIETSAVILSVDATQEVSGFTGSEADAADVYRWTATGNGSLAATLLEGPGLALEVLEIQDALIVPVAIDPEDSTRYLVESGQDYYFRIAPDLAGDLVGYGLDLAFTEAAGSNDIVNGVDIGDAGNLSTTPTPTLLDSSTDALVLGSTGFGDDVADYFQFVAPGGGVLSIDLAESEGLDVVLLDRDYQPLASGALVNGVLQIDFSVIASETYLVGVVPDDALAASNYELLVDMPAEQPLDDIVGDLPIGDAGNANEPTLILLDDDGDVDILGWGSAASDPVDAFVFDVETDGVLTLVLNNFDAPNDFDLTSGLDPTGPVQSPNIVVTGSDEPVQSASIPGTPEELSFFVEAGERYIVRVDTAAGAGRYSLSIDAPVGGDDRINLVPIGDASNTVEGANTVGLDVFADALVDGFVGYENDTGDFYSVEAPGDGDLTLNLSGLSDDIDLILRDALGNVILTSANSGPEDEVIIAAVVAGETYIIEVDPGLGGRSPYTLDIDFPENAIDDVVNGLNIGDAGPVGSPHIVTNVALFGEILVDGWASAESDLSDAFRFGAQNSGFVRIDLSGVASSSDFVVRLYEEQVEDPPLLLEVGNSLGQIDFPVLSGVDYFIEVEALSGNSTYFLDVLTPLGAGVNDFVDNVSIGDAGDSVLLAHQTNWGSLASPFIRGTAGFGGDVGDYYSFVVPSTGSIQFWLEDLTDDLNLLLFDDEGVVVASSSELDFDDEYIEFNVPFCGVYTVAVVPQGGLSQSGYSLFAELPQQADFVNGGFVAADASSASAPRDVSLLPDPQTGTGLADIAATVGFDSDGEDAYRVTVSGSGLLEISLDGFPDIGSDFTNLDLFLLDSTGDLVAQSNNSSTGVPESISYAVQSGETYVVEVVATSGASCYTLDIEAPLASPVDDIVEGVSIGDAPNVLATPYVAIPDEEEVVEISGSAGFSGDPADVYSVTASGDGIASASLFGLVAELDIVIYDSENNPLVSSSTTNGAAPEFLEWSAVNGEEYLIEVFSSRQAGTSYNLDIILPQPTDPPPPPPIEGDFVNGEPVADVGSLELPYLLPDATLGFDVQATVDSLTDATDAIRFTAVRSENATFELVPSSSVDDIEINMYLLDSEGNVLAENPQPGNAQEFFGFFLEEGAEYTLVVEIIGGGATYEMSLLIG